MEIEFSEYQTRKQSLFQQPNKAAYAQRVAREQQHTGDSATPGRLNIHTFISYIYISDLKIFISINDQTAMANNINDDDLYAFDFDDSLSPPTNLHFFISSYSSSSSTHSHNFCPYPNYPQSDSDSDSDPDSDLDSNPFHDNEDEDDQLNFVTNLFASREQEYIAADDQDVNYGLGLGFGSGSRIEFDRVSEFSSTRGVNSSTDGLRVVGIESDSDSEEVGRDVNSRVSDDGETDSLGEVMPLFWDCLGFEERREANNEEFEWERVDEEGEGLSSVIDGIEQLSVASRVSINEESSDIGEEALRDFEWEVLLAVNNLDRLHELDHHGDSDGVSYLAVRDGYIYAAVYDTLFGQFVQNESALKGSPPASKAVVENLPSVALTKEELQENNVVCAVCKDEILVEEKVTRLPCCHHYHGDCIVPWLCIRNTCPVCRYELPTDDLDYEQRKTQRGSLDMPQDFQVRYNSELLP